MDRELQIAAKEDRAISQYLRDHSGEIKEILKSLDPGTEVRLAVDTDPILYTVWTGSVDFDTYHSPYCASGEITDGTDFAELTEDLIEEILDQVALIQ